MENLTTDTSLNEWVFFRTLFTKWAAAFFKCYWYKWNKKKCYPVSQKKFNLFVGYFDGSITFP